MIAIFTPDGVRLVVEAEPIPVDEAVRTIEEIAKKKREALENAAATGAQNEPH
jgi:hypothetical protein